MPDPRLESALTQLTDAARRIGQWQASPSPLTREGRARSERALARAKAAEVNARRVILALFNERVHLPELPVTALRLQQARAFAGQTTVESDGAA